MNEKLIDVEKFVKIGLNAISQATGEGYGSTTEDDLRVVFDAVKPLLSQPSQQSGGVVPSVGALRLIFNRANPGYSGGPFEHLENLEEYEEAGWQAIHAHLAAQQPPRGDFSGVIISQEFQKELVGWLYGDTLGECECDIDSDDGGKTGRIIRCTSCRAKTLTHALTHALALPHTEKGDGWISVKERLPELVGEYLVWRPLAHVPPSYDPNRTICEYNPGKYGTRHQGFDRCHDVTYWAELRSPPQDAGKVKP